MNPKFDTKNYKQYGRRVISKDFQQIDGILFSANLLLIKWSLFGVQPGIKKEDEKPFYEGVIKIAPVNTPIGRLAPTEYKLSAYRKPFSQFLDVGQVDIEYEIEVRNPKGIAKTEIEIWEYIEPVTYSQSQIAPSSSSSPVIA
jgi:hypothetical protein